MLVAFAFLPFEEVKLQSKNMTKEIIVDSETLEVEDAETGVEDVDPEIDDTVPPLEEEVTPEKVEELKADKKPDESDENEEETETEEETEPLVPKQPNPVDGETPREKALRIKVQELRKSLRDKDEVIKIAQPTIANEEYEALKEIYSDDELQKVEKLFDVIGKKKGYVKAEEIYTQSGNEVLEQFIEKHPEYKPENDLEDVRWETFKKILTNDYNRVGKNPKELVKLFEKVNRDVLEEFGESKVIASTRRSAEIQKIRSVSHAGGTKTEVVKKSNAPTDPKIRAMFKDFDDDDF